MSAGSKTNPGGYASQDESLEQFEISDERTPEQIASMLKSKGYDPVWKDWDLSYDNSVISQPADTWSDQSLHTETILN